MVHSASLHSSAMVLTAGKWTTAGRFRSTWKPVNSGDSTWWGSVGQYIVQERLVIYCQKISVSAAQDCATYYTPCRPLIRAFSGWILIPPPTHCPTRPRRARRRGETKPKGPSSPRPSKGGGGRTLPAFPAKLAMTADAEVLVPDATVLAPPYWSRTMVSGHAAFSCV